MDECERIELAGGELRIYGFGEDRRAPRDLEGVSLLAAALGDIEPFVRERAAHAAQNFFGDEISDGAFHHAPGRAGAQVNELLGVEQLLQLRLDFGVKVFESLPAVADHGRAKRAKGFLAYLDRPGDVQLDVSRSHIPLLLCHKEAQKDTKRCLEEAVS